MGSPMGRLTALRLLAGALLAATATGVAAQEESTNQVAANTAWSVFEDNDPRECWAVLPCVLCALCVFVSLQMCVCVCIGVCVCISGITHPRKRW